jgi:hypothetical protein
MIVRSHLPWPLRWAVIAASLGFSAALALWAFEFGKEIAGLDRSSRQELALLRQEVLALREANARARAVADTAESLLKAEKVAQEQLGLQLRRLEADKLALQADLGFFEGLMPVVGQGVQIRGMQLDEGTPGELRYRLLLMQPGRASSDFSGRWELLLQGTREGRPWTATHPGERLLQFRQYLRLEGGVEIPQGAVIRTARARVYDPKGSLRAELSARP